MAGAEGGQPFRMPPMTATSHPPRANREIPSLEPEDDSEWEYEPLDLGVSIANLLACKTFYLTVDLGVLDEDDEDEDDELLPEPEDDLDEGDPDLDGFPQRLQEGAAEVVDDKLVERDIEILDLHTPTPSSLTEAKSLRGTGQKSWELSSYSQSTTSPLRPLLQRLPGDVDLLAASSARILTTEKILKIPDELDRLKKTREAYGIRLPVLGKHHYDEKKKQVRFLENLMAVKIKRARRTW
ncbi:unnamed protein product [Parascedosporium putredinis]|uniref:Uncharacterized protein n=1 Tax=Parascedosporium putredinis TaxID=1442378 RepID=A0A9P1H1T7_9PEZI|nr:unnamed protein product [Parascedosporium putredinis]CAI7995475.1 unnamed protein product [Parascedosporium putredinis]